MTSELTTTRDSLHAIAEYLLAGPQYEHSGSIRLRITDGGFGTSQLPLWRLDGVELVGHHGVRALLEGRSCRAVADEVGLSPRTLRDVYQEAPRLSIDDPLHLDPARTREIVAAFGYASTAFALLAPVVTPVLWPQHFDLAVTMDGVSYGVAAPAGEVAECYAYVRPPRECAGEFWNTQSGSVRPMSSFGSAAALVDYFRDGHHHAHSQSLALTSPDGRQS